MKLAVISDTHGNALALENCMNFILSQSIDRIFHLGDSLGYLPFTSETLAMLELHNVICLKGNHEAMALGEIVFSDERDRVYGMSAIMESITPNERSFISSWKDHIEWRVDEKTLMFVHGCPWNRLEGYVYPDSDKSKFADINADIVIMGHTHYPYVVHQSGKLLVNVGSVGLPRDVGYLSTLCILDTQTLNVQIFRIPFDVDSLASREKSKNVHPSVWKCMKRRKSDFVGELVVTASNHS